MFCTNCGKNIGDEKVCPFCNTPVPGAVFTPAPKKEEKPVTNAKPTKRVGRKGPAPSDPEYKQLCNESWVCFNCGTLNDGGDVFCKRCNLTRPAPEGIPEYYANVKNQWWRCNYCGTINNGKDKRCRTCNKR